MQNHPKAFAQVVELQHTCRDPGSMYYATQLDHACTQGDDEDQPSKKKAKKDSKSKRLRSNAVAADDLPDSAAGLLDDDVGGEPGAAEPLFPGGEENDDNILETDADRAFIDDAGEALMQCTLLGALTPPSTATHPCHMHDGVCTSSWPLGKLCEIYITLENPCCMLFSVPLLWQSFAGSCCISHVKTIVNICISHTIDHLLSCYLHFINFVFCPPRRS